MITKVIQVNFEIYIISGKKIQELEHVIDTSEYLENIEKVVNKKLTAINKELGYDKHSPSNPDLEFIGVRRQPRPSSI
jgi:hypothetical protein